MEKGRALLFDSGLKKEMWGGTVYTSAYILNRFPTEAIKTTPYKMQKQMWKQKRPNMKNMQLFGCEAYAKIFQPVKKLDERSKRYTFIGYASISFRLWDEDKRKITIARDVKFREQTVKKIRKINKIKTINLTTEEMNLKKRKSPKNQELNQELKKKMRKLNSTTLKNSKTA